MTDLAATRRILAATPAVVRALVGDLPESLVRARYGPNTFSPFDVIGHLILGERLDWIPRARIMLEHGDTRPFDPFPWDGVDSDTEDATVAQRLDVFERLRRENLDSLDAMALTDADLRRPGAHPVLGPVTLGEHLSVWGVHDLHHVAQIGKAISYQFRDAVGPWRPHVKSIPPDA